MASDDEPLAAKLDEILRDFSDPMNGDDGHHSVFYARRELLAAVGAEIRAIRPEKRQRIDDDADDFGSFCSTCGLSTDTELNTGKCYCDHFNEAVDAMTHTARERGINIR